MSKRNLCICFDAFGTLFQPRRPIAEQYAEVARSFGLSGFSDEEVHSSFKAAFKRESKQNPNYGKANGLNAEKWWTNIIQNTFQPLVGSNQRLPPDLTRKLLHRFWSKEGYMLFPDVQPLLHKLRNHFRANNGRVVVGVVTNSDDRVPDILSSFGMRVSPLRYGSGPTSMTKPRTEFDVDFTVISYDVGYEKPDKRIFAAAEEMLYGLLQVDGTSLSSVDRESWLKVYVGDEYEKDVKGALNAGWKAVLVDRQRENQDSDVEWLDDHTAGDLQEVFRSSNAIGFTSLSKLAQWLPSNL